MGPGPSRQIVLKTTKASAGRSSQTRPEPTQTLTEPHSSINTTNPRCRLPSARAWPIGCRYCALGRRRAGHLSHRHAVGSRTRPMKSGSLVSSCSITKMNGRSARNSAGGGADSSPPTTAVAAVAIVPNSSTSIVAW